jgi:hypothetical protein
LDRQTTFANDISANIRGALENADAHPFQAAYVTHDPHAVGEASVARVGTILIADGAGDAIPDILIAPHHDTRQMLMTIAGGTRVALLNELCVTWLGDRTRLPGKGLTLVQKFLTTHYELDSSIAPRLDVVIAGRYFPTKDARHIKHQLSKRLLYLKAGDPRGAPVVDCLEFLLRKLFQGGRYDAVTRIPPKPSKTTDCLGEALMSMSGRGREQESQRPWVVDLNAVVCIRDYPDQKGVGNWANRAENVRGAFASAPRNVRGKRFLILDDVLTSGATIVEAVRTLYEAGAAEVLACPISIDQAQINYNPDEDELPCGSVTCDGKMQLRFKRNGKAAFWGCSNWNQSGDGCSERLDFQQGWLAINSLNVREKIMCLTDERF